MGQDIPDPRFLEQYAATYRFQLGRPTSIQILPDASAVLLLRSGPRSFEQALYEFDPATGRQRVLLTADGLLNGAPREPLTAAEKARRERLRQVARGITSYQLSRDGRRVLVPLSERLFVLDRLDSSVREVDVDGRAAVPRLSPDGEHIAYVRDGDLYVTGIGGGPARRLTLDAGGTVTNGLAEFVAAEEMGRHRGFWWSPDSAHLACQRTDTKGVEMMTIADATEPGQPARRWPYPRPGKSNADVRLMIVPIDGGPVRWVEWSRRQFPYLAAVTWQEGAPLTILVQNRRQTEQALLRVDPATGQCVVILAERDDAWVAIDQKMPRWLSDGSGFLWKTERNGAPQLDLHDRDGGLIRAVTPPEPGLRGLVHLDEQRRLVYVAAGGDPTETHLYRVALDAGGPATVPLTDAAGVHEAVFSRNGDLYVHLYSGMSDESITVRRANGEIVGELESVAESPGFEVSAEFVRTGGDPDLNAVLVKPRDFDPASRYPVLVHVYGGPTGQMVRKSGLGYLLDQWMADHGYVVARIDGRGTPGRGSAWQRAVKGNLIDLPLADQVNGLIALGERYPWLDLSRVGVYGWSFGGYFSAMAVMRRPDVFDAAVAGAPVVDWLDYDTHYTERYLGLPEENPTGYDVSNVLTYAADLDRPLLIVHGTTDDNVYFTHSLKLADALFRAGRPYELLPLAGLTHMVPDPVVVKRLNERIMGFFDEHVRGEGTEARRE